MNNEMKMKIKGIPVISGIAKAGNRTIGRAARRIIHFPSQRKRNGELLTRLERLRGCSCPRIWHFGVPTHPNLGDQAQKFVIERWLSENYPIHELVKIPSAAFNGGVTRTLQVLRGIVRPEDLLVMQSGHTMDGLHPDETAHRFIAEAFPNNRIVFFPTSIQFLSKRAMKKDIRYINAHRRTLFLARDPVSAGKARQIYPNVDVRLCPDVVASLIGRYSFSGEREGILFCTRNDGEKLYSYEAIDALARRLSELGSLARTDTTVDWKDVDLDSDEAWWRIEEVIASYARYSLIITDRYHGTIFARIANTPVIVLRTTDHKVTSGAQWFTEAGDNAIVVAGDLGSVSGLAHDLMERFPEGASAPPFAAPYYNGLYDVIEAM